MTAIATNRSKRRMNPKGDPLSPWWHIDLIPVLMTAGLSLVGLVAIYSATRGRDPENYSTFFVGRQGIFIAVGLVLLAVVVVVDYRELRPWMWVAYFTGLLSLAAVLVIGVEVNGATSWFSLGRFQLQPSEFMKLALIGSLAAYLSRARGRELAIPQIAIAITIAMLPIGLTLVQPDVGTAMVMMVIAAVMLLVGGANFWHLGFLLAAAVLGLALIINSPLLVNYQSDRLEAFLDPEGTSVAAYNQKQAEIAIGNGGLTGTGFGEGTQTNSGLVPEQQTDFIFTVVGEEFGFVGGIVVLTLFAGLIWRLYRISRLAGDDFGALLSAGVLAMILFQMFQSVGMTMGIMPITGIPLPFVSYGGSSALTSFLAIGLVLNVHMRRFVAEIDNERAAAQG